MILLLVIIMPFVKKNKKKILVGLYDWFSSVQALVFHRLGRSWRKPLQKVR